MGVLVAWGSGQGCHQVGNTFCKCQNLGSKNPKHHLFFTALAKGKLKKTTVLLQQTERRSCHWGELICISLERVSHFHLWQRGTELQVEDQSMVSLVFLKKNYLEVVETNPNYRRFFKNLEKENWCRFISISVGFFLTQCGFVCCSEFL